jgi:diguanylate cyclase (GGDEF)-like protein
MPSNSHRAEWLRLKGRVGASRASDIDVTNAALEDRWAGDLRLPIAIIRRHAGSLRGSEGALTDAQRQSVLVIEEQAERLGRLFGALESIEPPASVAEDAALQPSGAGAARPPAILIADDDDLILESLGDLLSDRYRLTFARDGREAMVALCLWPFDLAIIDLGLPVVDGFKLVKAVRGSGEFESSAVMLLSGRTEPRFKVHGLALGAADYVTKPFDAEELIARIARILTAANREASLRADAMTDPLTGLANYRSFSQSLERELERSRRYATPLSLIMVDLDRLKALNDEHGHDAGSDAIRLAARALTGAVRKFEVVARLGGDEYAVVLPSTGASDARRLAERLRAEIGAHVVHGVRLSASVGVATWDGAALNAAQLIKASDEALYRAKRAGRNRVEVSTP